MNAASPMRTFNPRRVAYYEKENYVAYYQKDWLKLLRVSVGMVGEAFGLNLPQAIYAAYLVARAEIAFAPVPNNDVSRAEAYMRKFYRFIQNVHREEFDVAEAARLEVKWWSIHRELFANSENEPLVDALADLWAKAYGVPLAKVRQAAHHRAMGMLASDRWVRAGKPLDSPLLAEEEAELGKSYQMLREAIA